MGFEYFNAHVLLGKVVDIYTITIKYVRSFSKASVVDCCLWVYYDDLFIADIPTDGIHTTEWEREREREEFSQAARLYRPLAAMIASRFTRAKYDDDDKVLLPANDSVRCLPQIEYLKLVYVLLWSYITLISIICVLLQCLLVFLLVSLIKVVTLNWKFD